MAEPAPDMTRLRRAALDEMAATSADVRQRPLTRIEVDLGDHLAAGEPVRIPDSLLSAVSRRLVRDRDGAGPGVALVTGLDRYLDLDGARRFHQRLFRAVWADFRLRSTEVDGRADHRIKASTTADGVIPLGLYGSRWSFKQLHADRDVLLFSHLYGPAAGFTGGTLLIVDIRAYMRRHRLRFDDLFRWSEEQAANSKPVLRREHHDAALDECGVELGQLGPDAILFVNNTPGAGILHGVTPVTVRDPDRFVREYHRCSVKDARIR